MFGNNCDVRIELELEIEEIKGKSKRWVHSRSTNGSKELNKSSPTKTIRQLFLRKGKVVFLVELMASIASKTLKLLRKA